MLIAIATLVFLALSFAAMSGLMNYASRLAEMGAVLPYRELSGTDAALPQEMARSVRDRVLLPLWTRLTGLVGGLLPGQMLGLTQQRLERAGHSRESARGYLE